LNERESQMDAAHALSLPVAIGEDQAQAHDEIPGSRAEANAIEPESRVGIKSPKTSRATRPAPNKARPRPARLPRDWIKAPSLLRPRIHFFERTQARMMGSSIYDTNRPRSCYYRMGSSGKC
jgi:hypothetical protein